MSELGVGHWLNKLILYLQVVASHLGASLCPGCSISNPESYLWLGRMAQVLAPLHLCRDQEEAVGSWQPLWSKPEHGRSVCLHIFQIKIYKS